MFISQLNKYTEISSRCDKIKDRSPTGHFTSRQMTFMNPTKIHHIERVRISISKTNNIDA
jgi:hypothetical protein